MAKLPFLVLLGALLALTLPAPAITPAELEKRAKDLPTVPEADLPELPNAPTSFRGLIEHEGLEGHTWVSFPFVENPGSFGFDAQGALYVVEANRFWQGVPDLRGANELIRDDFKAVTVEDRLALYEKFATSFPEDWFTRTADRIIKLEDQDGNGAADHRTLFSDRFNEPLDGLGFSVLADEGSVYFTCLPHVWKLTDTDGDGVADEEKAISSGYGPRVSFIGHDLHGITRGPDGLLYFSVGDRGYHVTDTNGKTHLGSGKGAIFRCASDGSGLEVICTGLRNPQELVFDNYGNLFTFDNTGDIGDLARMVYVLEGSDSGWDMSHQSPHQYVQHLDWGDFHPEKSMWVAERMYDLHHPEQPQWLYPPASHVARGPSGVTQLTGVSLPADLRDKFLLANYRGPSENCTILSVEVRAKGAGYTAVSEEILFKGVGASDVELGYDGNIYLCDFGGGWSVNENGSIQVVGSTAPEEQAAGRKVATLFREGFDQRDIVELRTLLRHSDRRVRQAAQFALVKDGKGLEALQEVARGGRSETLYSRLHAIWGLGQAGRAGTEIGNTLIELLADRETEVRANAARVLGDLKVVAAKTALIERLADDESDRVKFLAAIALSRIGDRGETDVTEALFSAVGKNGGESPDIVLRHALLTGLDRIASDEAAIAKAQSASHEERLLSVLKLRRSASPELVAFLDDSDAQIRNEAIRSIYDTAAVDSEAGDTIAALGRRVADLPETVQRRIVAANYRRGEADHAREMLALASNKRLEISVRKAALIGLQMWDQTIETDPVHGTYRPIGAGTDRSLAALGDAIGDDLKVFLTAPNRNDIVTLAMELATTIGVELDSETLIAQVDNKDLGPDLRVAVIESLAKSRPDGFREIVARLLTDTEPAIRAAAMTQAFAIDLDGTDRTARTAITDDELVVARAALTGLATTDPAGVATLFAERNQSLRKGLWLDAYLLLSERGSEVASAYAAEKPENVFLLSEEGGSTEKGKIVFANQGACLQCHIIGSNGGAQGPDLSAVGKRLTRDKVLESIWNPGAEISEGYGMTTVMLKSGDTVMGRLASEDDKAVTVIGLDNSERAISRDEIDSVAPPVSAMPPMAAALAPPDLRDLVAYLSAQKAGGKKKDDSSHGDDEKIAK